ncbi:MAG: adenylate/guanylate cyclase domain-containing protein, partial [Pseudomonadota bacterium]
MDLSQIDTLTSWLFDSCLEGRPGEEIMKGAGESLVNAGFSLRRAYAGLQILHPTLGAEGFIWRRNEGASRDTYLREQSNDEVEDWQGSPFWLLYDRGWSEGRWRLSQPSPEGRPAMLDAMAEEGMTDYIAFRSRVGGLAREGEDDVAIYSSWAVDNEAGFSNAQLSALKSLVPRIAHTLRSTSEVRNLTNLLSTYLGRDPAERILRGAIVRGQAEPIEAVIWFSDLRGYTKLSDTVPPEQVIPLLNDYGDAIVSAIQDKEGQVLKFIGDGILAIFRLESRNRAAQSALAAAKQAMAAVEDLNAARTEASLPITEPYIGLTIGEVFYGNIGARERLDFTVVGPAVNEASRISAMSRSLERQLVVSQTFADCIEEGGDLVSLG